jgi:hypothetical protein
MMNDVETLEIIFKILPTEIVWILVENRMKIQFLY